MVVYRIRGEKVERYIVLAQIGFYLQWKGRGGGWCGGWCGGLGGKKEKS